MYSRFSWLSDAVLAHPIAPFLLLVQRRPSKPLRKTKSSRSPRQKNALDDIKNHAEKASESNTAIQNALTLETAQELAQDTKEHLDAIVARSDAAINALVEVKRANDQIKGQIPQIQRVENRLFDLEQAGKSEARRGIYNLLRWFFGLGAGAVIIGSIVAFIRPQTGLMIAGIGILTTAIASAGIYYLQWLAISGMIIAGLGLLGVVGGIVYTVWKSKVDKDTAQVNTEIIEMLKDDLPEDIREKYFGTDEKFGVAEIAQTKSVQKNIEKIRKDFQGE